MMRGMHSAAFCFPTCFVVRNADWEENIAKDSSRLAYWEIEVQSFRVSQCAT